ncbi:MAG: hypothetical protein QOH29_696, partial [Actinomycetota bacterium]|nr:hypothetical protein [Actinomycetota bacterium]
MATEFLRDHAEGSRVWGCGQLRMRPVRMLWNGRVDEFSLPGYDVLELLGFGGSGEVWQAREQASGDLVALKRLRRLGSPEALAREAALLASVRHDHVVRLRG